MYELRQHQNPERFIFKYVQFIRRREVARRKRKYLEVRRQRNAVLIIGDTKQINGREGETATFFSRSFVILCLRVIGFAPRHLSRYVSFCDQWQLTFTRC